MTTTAVPTGIRSLPLTRDVPVRLPRRAPADRLPPSIAPRPGSDEERARFHALQAGLAPLYRRIFPDRRAERSLVVIPSMTLPREELVRLSGANHYEERLLCLLMLLRLPHTSVVYVTSEPIQPAIVDYYLNLLPGIPACHARRRLTLLSCEDRRAGVLSEKILARPGLIERIRAALPDPSIAHMTCFNATGLERTLAVRLGIPLYGCDPDLLALGTKSGSREVFREAGVAHPAGFEHLRDADDIADALHALRRAQPSLRRAVIKLDEGFSGEGNAIFSFDGAPDDASLRSWIRAELPARTRFEAAGERWERYAARFGVMGGIVEAFLEGEEVRSPSVQCRVDPTGRAAIISTHEQILGGPSGQTYLGCAFPAASVYRSAIHRAALRISDVLARRGVIGRFGIDFIAARRGERWECAAIEINLRKGGTTHPFLMLQFLTDGSYDAEAGTFRTAAGQPCYYHATDNLTSRAFRGMTADDLIDIAVDEELHFHAARQQGVVFHLIGALRDHGKLGAVCIGPDRATAARYYRDTVCALDHAAAARRLVPAERAD
jgi:hypothetical protein